MRYRVLCLFLILLAIYLHFFTNFDVNFQSIFYSNGHWIIDPNDPVIYFYLYKLPKAIIVVLGLLTLTTLILNQYKKFLNQNTRTSLITVLVSIVLFPIFINLLKELIRQPCPRDLKIFGGHFDLDFISFFLTRGDIKCFPGAHASAPFSMLSAVYLFNKEYYKKIFISLMLFIASIISMYQVLRGVHFITDTVCTAGLSWLFIYYVNKINLLYRQKV